MRIVLGHYGALMFFGSLGFALLVIPAYAAYMFKTEGSPYWYIMLLAYIPIIGMLLMIAGIPG